MSESDGSSVDVASIFRESELIDTDRVHRGERFVDFPEVDVGFGNVQVLEELRDRDRGSL